MLVVFGSQGRVARTETTVTSTTYVLYRSGAYTLDTILKSVGIARYSFLVLHEPRYYMGGLGVASLALLLMKGGRS